MSQSFHVVITDLLSDELLPEREVLGDLAEVTALQAQNEAQLLGHIEHADAIIVYHEVILTRMTLSRLQKCRVIVRGGVGFDNVHGAVAREYGIPLANTPDYGSEEVADSALGMLLSLGRGIHRANSLLRAAQGNWTYEVSAPLVRLRGRVLGIVGLGRIGTAMAIRGRSLGMDVAFYDPYKPDGYDKALGIRRVETLEELVAQSLAVSLHCPLTEETHHLIDAQVMAAMPPNSFLVNTARGGVVDYHALTRSLASGHLAGAGIDVLPQEPPATDEPLLLACAIRSILPIIVLFSIRISPGTARTASARCDGRRRRLAGALLGKPLRNVVN